MIKTFEFDDIIDIQEYNVENIDVYNLSIDEDESYCANRIVVHNCTEMASVYESGILAQHESEAMESLKDSRKAQYFVFSGGSCKWCQGHQGILTRLVPANIVTDTSDDSLKSMGINDPNTDIASWIGKNNIGFKQASWRITTPAHPHNVATMKPIDIETEYYNEKTGEVELRQKKQKSLPKQVDYSSQIKSEKEIRKPKKMGDNLVEMNGNIYEAVSADDYNRKLEESKKDRTLPIPVNTNSPAYKRIFEVVE